MKQLEHPQKVSDLVVCQDIAPATTSDVTSFPVPSLHPSQPTMRPTARTALRPLQSTSQCQCPRTRLSLLSIHPRRSFHGSQARRTDGVFKELTSMRVRTPWVEALRQQQAEGKQPVEPSGKPEVPKNRNLKPKHMDESYHSIVLPLARDPWLLDTYLNSSGHIRLGTIFMDLDALSGIIACKPQERHK
jgi:acyl-coenzyme A thioesterase 9